MADQSTLTITKEKLILRDCLAADRTDLANERTFLAYARTSFTFILAGITILKFFTTTPMYIFATGSIFTGIIILIWGFSRYNYVQKHIRQARGEPTMTSTSTSISLINLQSIKSYFLRR